MFDELTRDDWISLIIYGAFALLVARAIPGLFRGRVLAGVAALSFWAAALALILVGYAYRAEMAAVGQRVMATVFPGTVVETAPKEVTVFRRPDGQFVVTATAGRARLSFVLDTGASTVVLRAEDAARIGVPVARLAYTIPVSTANGRAMTAAVDLPQLKIGSIVEHDVEALVARAGALQENLLGMTYLNRLASFTVSNDRLVLREQ